MDTMPPFQATDALTATLEAQEWNVVFAGLQELPLKFSGPIVTKLQRQLARRHEETD